MTLLSPIRALQSSCALALLVLAGCAMVPPARMVLPDALATVPAEPLQGMGVGRSGDFTLGGVRGNFQRAADKLALFDTVSFDRATVRYRLLRADGSQVQAACRGRQDSVTLGMVMGQVRPYTLECQWSGALAATMTVSGQPAGPGARSERSGLFSTDRVTLELRSVHQLEGSPLPQSSPVGYVFTHHGQPVGAVEVNGTTPRVWRPRADSPLQEQVTLAAVAMALLWDTADNLLR